ncbi:enoyl-CoA hydratase/isomerase family protein [Ancylobacter polymorphus]|uniref:Enoyl-CoA hydratase-related protein n=1 Tax=Ancylobacter polymorphus TaxID=223390 RepID=A0A9E7A2F8_9HYPH|nr:enoyl-CoA hydratase-related protein [Ancylobacter polymorphus]UOK73320.1 enoyl-CoA hydratase-related protein [Ancylobacter polymorphus]
MSVDLIYKDDAAILTLNRPERLNALSYGTVRELDSALDEIEKSDARVLIITGKGQKAFCAGADITEIPDRTMPEQFNGTWLGQRTFLRLERLSIPSIALVNGYALGGGCELSLACTFRLATPNARFGLPEVKLGLVPGYGGTQRLPRLVGVARALEITMTGRNVLAEEALAIGLVNRIVVAEPLAEALAFGQQFSNHGLLVLRLIREAVYRGIDTTLEQGLKIEADLSTLSMQSKDGQEGLAAFIDKRPPKFSDT